MEFFETSAKAAIKVNDSFIETSRKLIQKANVSKEKKGGQQGVEQPRKLEPVQQLPPKKGCC